MNKVIHSYLFFGNRVSRSGLVLLLGVLLCVYFSYHLIHGERSLLRSIQLSEQIESSSQTLAALETEKQAIEKKVSMMRPGSIDRDLLEERIHVVLGYVTPDDYILSTGR